MKVKAAAAPTAAPAPAAKKATLKVAPKAVAAGGGGGSGNGTKRGRSTGKPVGKKSRKDDSDSDSFGEDSEASAGDDGSEDDPQPVRGAHILPCPAATRLHFQSCYWFDVSVSRNSYRCAERCVQVPPAVAEGGMLRCRSLLAHLPSPPRTPHLPL